MIFESGADVGRIGSTEQATATSAEGTSAEIEGGRKDLRRLVLIFAFGTGLYAFPIADIPRTDPATCGVCRRC